MHLEDVQIVVISLDRRPDRWANFVEGAQAAGIQDKVQRLSAVDAKEFVAYQHPAVSLLTSYNIKNSIRRAHYEIDKAGAVGASLSHIKAWNFLQNSSAPAIIVFEDDAKLPVDFKEKITEVLSDLPAEWDIVTFTNTRFGGGVKGCSPMEDSVWSSCTSLMGAHAYMVSRRGVQRLLARAYPIEMHVDAYMAFMARMNHVKMLWHPKMDIDQEFNDSDIHHGDQDILNIPSNMEKHGIVALDITSIVGLMTMAAVVGGLVSLAYVVKKR
jgi:GR25 family glycosyltransferase involved in LPS biosynthesis